MLKKANSLEQKKYCPHLKKTKNLFSSNETNFL